MKIFVMIFLFIFTPVHLAQAQSTTLLGYGLSVGQVTVNDPDGATKSTTDTTLFQLYYFHEYTRDLRYYTELLINDFNLDASTNHIGQQVEQKSIGFGLQKRFRFTRHTKPWIGIGLNVSQEEYTERHTIDGDGFLAQTFNDREETVISINLQAMSEYKMNKQFLLGLKAQYLTPIDDGVESFSISAIVLYQLN